MTKFVITVFALMLGTRAVAQDTTRLSLLFVGDIMQHDSNIATAYDPVSGKYDYAACFEYVAPIVRSAAKIMGGVVELGSISATRTVFLNLLGLSYSS